MTRTAQTPNAVHGNGSSLNKAVLDDVLAEIASTLKARRVKRDSMPEGRDKDALQVRIDRMQRGYDQIVKCFHRDCE